MSGKSPDFGEFLFRKYYSEEDSTDSNTSSHWKDYSSRFRVEFIDGKPVSLEGCGFGDMQERSVPNKWLARICNFSYFIRDPGRDQKKELLRTGKSLAKEMDAYFSFDCFRQVYSLALILKQTEELKVGKNPRILIIGDGFGYLSCLIKKTVPGARIILIDLGKTLLFQYYYATKIFTGASFIGIESSNEKLTASDVNENDFIFCPADSFGALEGIEIDATINIHSMQEMTYESISGYFSLIRKINSPNSFFYCCNRERKELVGGEVIEFDKYPWNAEDKILLDGYCPWCSYFLSTARTKRGAKILGVRVPFINYFDGPVRHRIAVLKRK